MGIRVLMSMRLFLGSGIEIAVLMGIWGGNESIDGDLG